MKPRSSLPSTSAPARERLIAAAKLVFARDGLHGATTRTIAQEAGVNEVTLFRIFQNKERLIAEVMESIVLQNQLAGSEGEEWSGDLKQNLRRYAEIVYAVLERDEALFRTMIGEARRYPDHAKKVVMDAVKPERARFIARLEAARNAGQVRGGVQLPVVADAFTGVLLAGMLRHTAGCVEDYSAGEFVETCVEIFAAGLAAPTA
ncbi:MAG: TetR/AcrR family transcriptional regulator [Verrucomicrobiota bacterium]